MIYKPYSSGFVALTSVIIFSAVLMIIAASLSIAGYFSRSSIGESEGKEISYFLAFTCLDQAYYKLSNDIDYQGNETLTIDSYQCQILPIVYQSPNTIITATANVASRSSELELIIDGVLNPVSFKEL